MEKGTLVTGRLTGKRPEAWGKARPKLGRAFERGLRESVGKAFHNSLLGGGGLGGQSGRSHQKIVFLEGFPPFGERRVFPVVGEKAGFLQIVG